MHKFSLLTILFVLFLTTSTVAACNTGQTGKTQAHVAMADHTSMPVDVQAAPRQVAEAYRFAAANPDVLQQIPCYCGCGAMGHDSNYACFWQGEGVFDMHALGCGICVDIALDTLRGLQQGKSLAAIRQQVDADYSRFGPSTDTPPVAMLGR